VTALDTSVCIPALISWHEHHELCRREAGGARIPAHALTEAYAVLTRLPTPHRLSGRTAVDLLAGWFGPADVLTPPARLHRTLLPSLAASGIEGGATYDALVGLTARHHGETLLTRDRRAGQTYELLGVSFRLIDG
jgi:predicted nucleic acid-binding protein